jgi:alpha-mannosidase
LKPDNVVRTALKKAEDEEPLSCDFTSSLERNNDIKLQLPVGANSAAETDLMEKPVADLTFQEGPVTVHTKPFEIKTVRIHFASNLPETPAERSSN